MASAAMHQIDASMEPALNRREDHVERDDGISHGRLQWSPPSTGGRTVEVGGWGRRHGGASMEPALNRREDRRARPVPRWAARCFNGARPQQAGGPRFFAVLAFCAAALQWSPPSTGGRTTESPGLPEARPPASMEPALNRREDAFASASVSGWPSLQWSPPSTGGRTAPEVRHSVPPSWASMEPALNRREDIAHAGEVRVLRLASMEPALNRREDIKQPLKEPDAHVLQWSPPSTGGRTPTSAGTPTFGTSASMEPALNRREDTPPPKTAC